MRIVEVGFKDVEKQVYIEKEIMCSHCNSIIGFNNNDANSGHGGTRGKFGPLIKFFILCPICKHEIHIKTIPLLQMDRDTIKRYI